MANITPLLPKNSTVFPSVAALIPMTFLFFVIISLASTPVLISTPKFSAFFLNLVINSIAYLPLNTAALGTVCPPK